MQPVRTTRHRDAYVPCWPPERFIVPLLNERIRALCTEFCGHQEAGARALDVGCGAQPFRRMLEEAGFDYTSVDIVSNPAVAVDFIAAIDEVLPVSILASGPYRFILCTEVLEHVADWNVAYANLARMSAPGGRILVTCPHFYPLHEVPYDFWRPTPFAIEAHAQRAGLRVLHIEQAGGPWEVLGTLLAETHCYPRSRSIRSRTLAKCFQTVRRFVNRALGWCWLRQHVELRGPYFLSSLAVLEKPVK